MDKIRPVLKQIFWVMTGLVVLMLVYGWRSASVALDERIAEDRKLLDTNKKAASAGKSAPNAQWTLAAKRLNEIYREEFSGAERELHAGQLSMREFPDGPGGKDLAQIPFMKRVTERAVRAQFRDQLYREHLLKQIKILDPFIVQDNRGLIVVDPQEIPQADQSQWRVREPTSGEIWNALEDLWLLRSLFESIANVNDGSERLGTSPVRQLVSLRFRGGNPDFDGTSSASAASGVVVPAFGGISGVFGVAGEPAAPAASTAGSTNPAVTYAGSFDADLLTEEFGAVGAAAGGGPSAGRAAAGTFGGGAATFGGSGAFGVPAPGLLPAAPAAGGTNAETSDDEIDQSQFKSRYVHHAAEYRTRAFQLHVRVVQDDIPALLAELTNSSFPVEILRVSTKFTTGEASTQSGVARSGVARSGNNRRGDNAAAFDVFSGARGSGRSRPTTSSRTTAPRKRGGLGGRGFGIFEGGGGSARRGAGARGGGSQWTPDNRDLLSLLASEEQEPGVAEKGEEQKSRALADVSLAEVRIAGLLTLYRTKAENLAAAETEKDEESEATVDGGVESDAAVDEASETTEDVSDQE